MISFSRWSNFLTFIIPIRTWRLKKAQTVYAILAGVWKQKETRILMKINRSSQCVYEKTLEILGLMSNKLTFKEFRYKIVARLTKLPAATACWGIHWGLQKIRGKEANFSHIKQSTWWHAFKVQRKIIVFESLHIRFTTVNLVFVTTDLTSLWFTRCKKKEKRQEKGMLYLHFLQSFEQLQRVEMPSQTLVLGP